MSLCVFMDCMHNLLNTAGNLLWKMLVNGHVGAAWNVWGTPKYNYIDPIVSQL